VMNELRKCDLPQRLDLSQTDYRNEGHAIRYHTNSFQVAFYDKVKDLQKARVSEKRAIENASRCQLDLFAKAGSLPKQLEVLRMEVRLGNRRAIRKLLKEIESGAEPEFEALFSETIARSALLQFWQHVRCQLPITGLAVALKSEDVLQGLIGKANGRPRPAKLLQRLGLTLLVESVGPRGAQALLSRYCSPRTWQRVKRDMRGLGLIGTGSFNALGQVDSGLRAFRPLRLSDFQA